ncbi:DUF6286 domain-containing protein [Streptomyces sp. bgisy100]|uniref:DUF6286 domain-containing protein n=1 Tax=Streptomyces sp. bgisy100 TaxID=3413783 RepID=UPI003D75005C
MTEGDARDERTTRRLPTVGSEASPGAGEHAAAPGDSGPGDSGPGRSGPGRRGPGDSGPEQSGSAATDEGGGDAGRNRFWSARRVPAGVVALLAVVGVALTLYDVAAVRAGRSAMAWRRELADQLAERPLDNPWMIGGAAVAMVVGLWLLVLALTPGLRALLPMRRPAGVPGAEHVRAGLYRNAAALVLRDRVTEVPGVQSVRAAVGRRRITIRARAHFRELDEVRKDVDAATADGLRELGLARRPALSVHVRRAAKR